MAFVRQSLVVFIRVGIVTVTVVSLRQYRQVIDLRQRHQPRMRVADSR